MNKKEIAISFLNCASSGAVEEGYSKYISNDFIHHNQYFKGDRQSLLEAMVESHQSNPNKSIEIKNIYLDGDAVISHSLVSKEEMQIAVVHIFRIKDDKIVELWDLGQLVDPNSPNQNGLF